MPAQAVKKCMEQENYGLVGVYSFKSYDSNTENKVINGERLAGAI
jgi:hypothetical protein